MWDIGHHPSSTTWQAVPPMYSGVARWPHPRMVKLPHKWAVDTSLVKGLARPATSGTSKLWIHPTLSAQQMV